MSSSFLPGTVVKCREREWIVVPSEDRELILLRPLAGSEEETCGIYLPLRLDKIESAVFPLPDSNRVGDFASAGLLRDAARLLLRSGAGPFRSSGRISFYPRPYQLVPLIMALRLDPIRLLVADDVGIGKTIEAGLIARELLDRGEIRRIAVICPAQLCDQWREELRDKFNIEAEVVRAGTAAKLERDLPEPLRDHGIFGYYRHIIVSIDYVKLDRHRTAFLNHSPDLIIVDEAHICARPKGQAAGQQQRHDFLQKIAQKENRHLVLLTATPHSGIEESFQSLLGLLKPAFSKFNLNLVTDEEKTNLAHHFIQRQRGDVVRWLGEETRFPVRESTEEQYDLSRPYQDLFDKVYEFAHEMVKSGETLSGWKQRIRYWTALALLRCVMSSPDAAISALNERSKGEEGPVSEGEEDEFELARQVLDPTEEETSFDDQPVHVVEKGEAELPDHDKRKLRQLAALAEKLRGESDEKIEKAVFLTEKFLKEGLHPILFCRYIATAKYVAQVLKKKLEARFKDLQVIAVTGEDPDELRKARVKELADSPQRVLVATDCLSEGINLQDWFNAVIHYDLPWNPNRLEQREGRVDRFGQSSPKVNAVLLYGSNNPIDMAVLKVLIRKSVKIHQTLGISVPLPVNSETVVQTVLKSLFMEASRKPEQLTFLETRNEVAEIHAMLDQAAKREKESRTRFAQKKIHVEEIEAYLQETNAVLGDSKTVESFVRTACERLGSSLEKGKNAWKLNPQALRPVVLREKLQNLQGKKFTFEKPPLPEGVTGIGRSHPFVESLARFLLEESLHPFEPKPAASRCGVIRTDAVDRLTHLFLLRIRYLLEEDKEKTPLLAEEVAILGFEGERQLEENQTLDLLETAKPSANLSSEEKTRFIQEALRFYDKKKDAVEKFAEERGAKLALAHRKVRKLLKEQTVIVKPQIPLDLLGLYLLVPVPEGVRR